MGGLWVSWLVLLAEFPGDRLGFAVVHGGDLVWLRFSAFAGSGCVVLFAAFGTRVPVGKALNGSSFVITSFVGWFCAVVTWGGLGSWFFLSFWRVGLRTATVVALASFLFS